MTERVFPILAFLAALALCPLSPGVINRVKAIAGGRRGRPLLQLYYDLWKLSRKSVVYSSTTGWLFRSCPVVLAGGTLAAALLTPMGGGRAVFDFSGDFLVWAGALTLARTFMVLAALDTGSSFEGMGGSRESWFAVLAEPALFLAMAALAVISSRGLSLSGFSPSLAPEAPAGRFMARLFACLALFLAALAENARIPVDDPDTHLELTMIHEVMILDHSGPDLAMIEYASALKLWLMGALAVGAAAPADAARPWLGAGAFFAGMLVFAAAVGCVESAMARLRLARVPQFLVGASVLAALSLVLVATDF